MLPNNVTYIYQINFSLQVIFIQTDLTSLMCKDCVHNAKSRPSWKVIIHGKYLSGFSQWWRADLTFVVSNNYYDLSSM